MRTVVEYTYNKNDFWEKISQWESISGWNIKDSVEGEYKHYATKSMLFGPEMNIKVTKDGENVKFEGWLFSSPLNSMLMLGMESGELPINTQGVSINTFLGFVPKAQARDILNKMLNLFEFSMVQ